MCYQNLCRKEIVTKACDKWKSTRQFARSRLCGGYMEIWYISDCFAKLRNYLNIRQFQPPPLWVEQSIILYVEIWNIYTLLFVLFLCKYM